MPSRRTTLIGLGVLAAGGTGAVATGAFSAATAERDVTVGFADDSDAILAFQSTSAYTEIGDGTGDLNDGELGINFENLTQRANFRFEDTFIIINNGTDTVSLESVGSGDGGEWRNESDNTSPVGVLVGDQVNRWQGTPNTDFTANADPDVIDDGSEDDNTGGGYHAADVNDFEINLAPPDDTTDPEDFGDWVSVGFEFGGFGDSDDIGGWEEEVPDTLQFKFGQVTE